jgi:rod shape-determining protein MreD
MAVARWLLVGALLVTATIIQLTVLPLLRLPGAVPDLVGVTVVALGLAAGPVRGAATGFAAGLLLDLVPPADGILGLSAVVLVVVGYLAGLLGADPDRSPLVTVGLTALLAAGAVLGLAMVGGIVIDPRVTWDRIPMLLVTQAAYAAILAPFVVPGVGALWRRVDPPPPRYEVGRP